MAERVQKQYWDQSWEAEVQLPDTFDPKVAGLRGLFRRPFHAFFAAHLPAVAPPGASLIEIGCGRSQLLPYFARQFGLRVAGLDYSEVGCEKAKRILQRDGVDGDVHCADLFDAAAVPATGYDVVFSFGLVEHFEDSVGVVRALARYARPGGSVLTLIPNMRGAVGALQKALSRGIFDIHVPLSAAALTQAHRDAGLNVGAGGYLLPAHFGVCNPGTGSDPRGMAQQIRSAAYRAAIAMSTGLLWIDERVVHLPASELLSPYAFTLATRPALVAPVGAGIDSITAS
ncbi:MAG: class I SAM-dependent methyltransferase [Casimicrobiaceae bacterium]